LQRPVCAADDVDQILKWQDKCSSTHVHCNEKAISAADSFDNPLLPTRVIDVGPSSSSEDPVLLETTFDQKSTYLALSHRWGGAQITRTTTLTLPTFRKRIALEDLCKTFRDAIQITRKLGLRYLWIDSLCIIQDSKEDWERESARMGEIYRNAMFTLSAASALSGDTGLLHERKELHEVEMPYLSESGKQQGSYFVSDRDVDDFTAAVVDGPLNQRGWTLQERHLSRRVIHFGMTQRYWECQSAVWEERSSVDKNAVDRFGGYLTEGLITSLSLATWDSSKNLRDRRQVVGRQGYRTWYWLVRNYSKRDLTYDQDKLPALSGLAKYFAAFCNNDEYLAGLWKGDINIGLLWHSTEGSALRRPSSYRSPSWSWAACDGSIDFADDFSGHYAVEDLNVNVTPWLDPFGKVASGALSLTGRLKAACHSLGVDPSHSRGWPPTNASVFNDEGSCIGVASFDEPQKAILIHSLIYCLMVYRVFHGEEHADFRPFAPEILTRRGEWAWVLMLKETDSARTFVRVGLAQIDQGYFEDVDERRITII
jgi:hypothetical protein